MENSNGLGGARIALLIDFDNVILGIDEPGFDIELVVNALRERGTIVVSRVYGDWYRHSRHRRKLMEHGVELVEAPAFGPVIKNSADIKIALDGYEIGMTMPHINTFCLVSGDSDFLPLIKKLQSLGKHVLVICGNRFTSDMLRRNCNEFISYENLLAASYGADEDATTLEGAFALLHRAMAALRERGSEIRTSTLKQMMIQLNPVFSEKTFGYSQFRGFLDKAGREGLIKLGPRDRVSGEFYVLLPEEDEAEVIENIERAEPAAAVGTLVEARRGRNRRREDRNGNESTRQTRENGHQTPTATEEVRPRSRREARLQALREQELEQQTPGARDETPAPPLETPLTPATDFSPATANEVRQRSIGRAELLRRGMHEGKVRFSGKTGQVETVKSAPQAQVETDTAPAPKAAPSEDLRDESANLAPAPETPSQPSPEALLATEETPEVALQPEEASEKPKRARTRRRKKSTSAPIAESATSPTEENQQTPAQNAENTAPDVAATDENAPETPSATPSETTSAAETPDETTAETATPVEAEVATTENITSETAPPVEDEVATATEATATEATAIEATASDEKKPRRRRTTRKKTEDQPAEATASAPEQPQDAPKEKPKRTRRKKTEETTATVEKAILPDGTEQKVSTEALIAASANTPVAQEPKTRTRRTARRLSNEAAGVKSTVDEKIVTGPETTGELSARELAEIPVPNSEDEL